MKKLTRQEKHEQCMREIRGTLIVAVSYTHLDISFIFVEIS